MTQKQDILIEATCALPLQIVLSCADMSSSLFSVGQLHGRALNPNRAGLGKEHRHFREIMSVITRQSPMILEYLSGVGLSFDQSVYQMQQL